MDRATREQLINRLYQEFQKPGSTHFDLLGVSKTAIQKEIEKAYENLSEVLSDSAMTEVEDPGLKTKAATLKRAVDHAFEVLTDYKQRAEYEKRGFREASEEEEPPEDDSEVARELFRKARELHGRKDFATVITTLEKAIRLDETKADYYHLLGTTQSRVPSLRREAEENLSRAAELEPWNAEHQAALGTLFYYEKLYNRAESFFQKAVSLEPDHKLARARLQEIRGPEKTAMDSVKEGLQKVLPTFFGKKKK